MTSLTVGSRLGPWMLAAVRAEQMRVLADLLDDPNQIHLDPELVRSLGMGDRVINQGPANLGYILNMLTIAARDFELERIHVRFVRNVFADDAVTADGHVDDVDRDRVHCTVWLDVGDAERAVEGTATLRRQLG